MRIGATVSSLLLTAAMALSANSAASEPIVVDKGVFVCQSGIPSGWYTISPEDDAFTKAAVFDCQTFDQPVHLASYVWYEDGFPVLSDDPSGPEEYTIPLWDGCLVLAGYYFGIEYDKATGEAGWNQYEDEAGPMGRVRLKFVAPLGELPASEAAALAPETDAPASDRLLYEDEYVAVSYSDLYVVTYDKSSFLKLELLIQNKTDKLLDVSCDSIVVDGCAVHISKYVDVPANSVYLNMWTCDAEQYLKYGIEVPRRISMVFDYSSSDRAVRSGKIQTREITVQ